MSIPVGIDLGTTFSCVAALTTNNTIELIGNDQGHKLTPSMVYICPDTGKCYVGEGAYIKSSKCPENLLKDAKRLLGRKFDDTFVQKIRNSEETNFVLAKGRDDKVVYQIQVQGQMVTKTPEEVSAQVLKYLKKIVENYFGKPINDVVISIPAYFSNAQRAATRNAADLAGFRVLRLVTEPVAGALHYVQNKNVNSRLLVFDWGGGTLDVSIIKVKNKMFEVDAVYGDTQLGGRQIDEKLFGKFYIPVKRHPKQFIRRLLASCVMLKEQMTSHEEMTNTITCYDGEEDLDLTLTRTEFDELNKEIFNMATDIVNYALAEEDWKPSDIDNVVLVGGSTRILKIRQMLESIFGEDKIRRDVNPDEAVALGACLQARAILQTTEGFENYKITDVTPMSLGLDGYGSLMSIFIPRSSKLPKSVTKTRITVYNNQTEVVFGIYEGERTNNEFNNKLGSFTVSGLPKKRAGDVEFSVTFNLDADGILTVTAAEHTTGRENKLVVTMGEYRLSQKRLSLKKEELRRTKHEDALFETFITSRNSMIKKVRHILYDSEKIKNQTERQSVIDRCEQFIKLAEDLDFRDMDRLEGQFTVTMGVLNPILKTYKMLEIA